MLKIKVQNKFENGPILVDNALAISQHGFTSRKYPKPGVLPQYLVPKGALVITNMSYMDLSSWRTHLWIFLIHYVPELVHSRIYSGLFHLIYPLLGVLPPYLVPKGALVITNMTYMDLNSWQTHVWIFLIHYLPELVHSRIYSGLFPLKYPKLGVLPPYLVPKGALVIPNMSYMDLCLLRTHMGILLTHYLPESVHFRIYFWLFPLKYPKIGIFTPVCGPKTGILHHKMIRSYGFAHSHTKCN